MNEKRCVVCKETHPLTAEFFHRNGSRDDGFRAECKKCRAAYRSTLRRKNLSEALTREKENRERYGKARSEYQKQRWAEDAEHRERSLAKNREWHRKNRERRLAINRAWRANNPDRVRATLVAAYRRDKLRYRISGAVYICLKQRGSQKSRQSLEATLGYTIDELRIHIERQFSHGMTWENWGKVWELDHILPLSGFSIAGPDCPEFRAAWAITNLRPLLKARNRSKGGKRTLLL